jgi:hypothetical protein
MTKSVEEKLPDSAAKALATLTALLRIGNLGLSGAPKKNPITNPKNSEEALKYANLRLQAAKIIVGLRFGTKSRGPIFGTDAEMVDNAFEEFLALSPKGREALIEEQIASGEVTLEEADAIRERIEQHESAHPPAQEVVKS